MPEQTITRASAVPGREINSAAARMEHLPAPWGIPLGARPCAGGRCEFRVWAPRRELVEIHIVAPEDRRVALLKMPDGYHEGMVDRCSEGARYFYRLDGGAERPDPASRHQPEGVHGPSEVVGTDFEWHDQAWKGVSLEDYVIYELHVGTFTEEGTFDAVIAHLDSLKEIGITAIELMPIGQFPGERNWGYDGTYVNAAQSSYGGPRGLKRLVNACHQRGLAILLDVVYNHFGPEGSYVADFAPYFTDRYKTPWGPAINFDGPLSDHVRWFFIHNALQWIDEFHIDGVRVDAVHAIVDHSAEPFLQDLNAAIRQRTDALGRRIYSIAESDLNDPRVITPQDEYGLGFHAQWMDDLHHSLHVALTGEKDGYYEGFSGRPSEIARVLTTGYLYVGQHSPYRRRKYGLKPRTTEGSRFVVASQTHDQVGNRMMGERLAALLPVEQVRLAAAVIILSPFIPMLFMGEEYGEKAPFQYFISHGDRDLIQAVRDGRREEFEDFVWEGEPPDPQDEETFRRSKLNHGLAAREEHASIRRLFTQLLSLRREMPSLRQLDLSRIDTHADDPKRVLLVRRWSERDQALIAFNFDGKAQTIGVPFAPAAWRLLIDTGATLEESRLTLPPNGFALFGL